MSRRLVEFAAAEAVAHALQLAGEKDERCFDIRLRAWEALAPEERHAIQERWGELLGGLARKVPMLGRELSDEDVEYQAQACAEWIRRGGLGGATRWLEGRAFGDADRRAIILALTEVDANSEHDARVSQLADAATSAQLTGADPRLDPVEDPES